MATTISTSFASIYLSAHLPESVSIYSSAESISVSVAVDGDEVFNSVYYPFQNQVSVRDLRTIVEDAIYNEALDMATVTVSVGEYGGITDTESFKVICSEYKTTEDSGDFLTASFLTTRRSATIPKDGYVLLHYFAKAYQEYPRIATICYSPANNPNTTRDYTVNYGRIVTDRDKINIERVDYTTYSNILQNYTGGTFIIRSVDIRIGGRRFYVFFTDEKPAEVFSFWNAFGMTETAYLFGIRNTKTEMERGEAVCGRKTHYYDQQVSVKHQMETAALSVDEGLWLNQLFTSRFVSRMLDNGSMAEVLVCDVNSEVTDNDSEWTRHQFSWRYADNDERI